MLLLEVVLTLELTSKTTCWYTYKYIDIMLAHVGASMNEEPHLSHRNYPLSKED